MRIAIDFDGTIVEHEYPHIGRPVAGAIEGIKQFKEAGAEIILWTMRSGKELQEAVDYCAENGIVFDAVNEGIDDRNWTTSQKVYANIYIDDAAFGCPLMRGYDSNRPIVAWSHVTSPVLSKIKFDN